MSHCQNFQFHTPVFKLVVAEGGGIDSVYLVWRFEAAN